MTKRQNKVRRHPTFTIGELKAIRLALVRLSDPNGTTDENITGALAKVSTSIVYREDEINRWNQRKRGDDA